MIFTANGALVQLEGDHFDGVLHEQVQVDHLLFGSVLPREVEQALHDRRSSFRFGDDLLEVVLILLTDGLLVQDFSPQGDCRQRVVELMGNASDQLADRGQLFTLDELLPCFAQGLDLHLHGIDQRLPVDGIGNQVRDGRQQAHLAFIQAGRRIDAKYPQRLVVGNQVEG